MVKVSSGQDVVVAEVDIAAPIERVFQAITDPSELARWWGHDQMYRSHFWKLDLQPQTEWRCDGKMADGKPFHVSGTVLEVDPPRLLVYTWKPSWEDLPDSVVRWELSQSGPQTHLRIHHSGFGGHKMEGYADGWTRIMGWLGEHLQPSATKQ